MNKREERFYEKFKKRKMSVEDLKKAVSLAGNLGNISEKFRLLLRMINADIKGNYKIPAMDKIKIIGAVVYVVTPIDAIFDIIPFFGFADDIAVVTYVLTKISDLVADYEEYEKAEKKKTKDENVDFDNLRVVNEDEGE